MEALFCVFFKYYYFKYVCYFKYYRKEESKISLC